MIPRSALAASLVGWLVLAGPSLAVQPDEVLADGALEKRARSISEELRCLVCQNQSIDDSDAPLARDLRILVRDRLKGGEDDDAVRRFIVSRYGEYVLLKPVVAPHTWLLWLGPAAILVLGLAGLLRARRARPDAPEKLTDDEERRLRALLDRSG